MGVINIFSSEFFLFYILRIESSKLNISKQIMFFHEYSQNWIRESLRDNNVFSLIVVSHKPEFKLREVQKLPLPLIKVE